jgi:hypothetical protein
MADRSFLTPAAWTLAVVLAGYLLVHGLRTPPPAPQPKTIPAATTLAPERPPEPPAVSAPTASEMPPSGLSPTAHVMPVATPEPRVTASASTQPTPDPAEAARRAEQEQRIRSELATAKANAESLSAAANAECPDLKPGELRHPGAVGHCARLRSEAAQAVSQYEVLKKQALAAGIVVQ